jgi:hypothetical protein
MPYRDVLDPASGLYETCARHSNRQVARTVQFLHLCDDCTRHLVRDAFNNRPPIYHGETITAFCGLCNELKEVTLREWFVCGICWNVVLSYQKAFVAPKVVQAYWAAQIAPTLPTFRLEESEQVVLAPYARTGKTKKEAAAILDRLDFLVSEEVARVQQPRFHIELKTGPSAIETMTEFQLDVNDSNDIAGAVNHTHLPAYIFHVQLDHEYRPPTRRAVVRGIWWTDVITLNEHRKDVRNRRGEDKDAGYYDTAAFQPIETFRGELQARRFEDLHRRVLANPITLL